MGWLGPGPTEARGGGRCSQHTAVVSDSWPRCRRPASARGALSLRGNQPTGCCGWSTGKGTQWAGLPFLAVGGDGNLCPDLPLGQLWSPSEEEPQSLLPSDVPLAPNLAGLLTVRGKGRDWVTPHAGELLIPDWGDLPRRAHTAAIQVGKPRPTRGGHHSYPDYVVREAGPAVSAPCPHLFARSQLLCQA